MTDRWRWVPPPQLLGALFEPSMALELSGGRVTIGAVDRRWPLPRGVAAEDAAASTLDAVLAPAACEAVIAAMHDFAALPERRPAAVTLAIDGGESGSRTLRILRWREDGGGLPVRALALLEGGDGAGDGSFLVDRMLGLTRALCGDGASPHAVRQLCVDALREVAAADAAALEECRGDRLVRAACSGDVPAEPAAGRPLAGTPEELSLRLGAVLRLAARSGAAAGDGGETTIVPLCAGGVGLGVVTLRWAGAKTAVVPLDHLELLAFPLAQWLAWRQRLASEDRRRHLVLDALPVLVAYVDREQRYVENNAAYCRWFGTDARDLRGRHLRDVLGAQTYGQVRPHVEAALAGEYVRFEATVDSAGLAARHVIAEYLPDRGEEGGVAGFFALITDVQDRNRADRDFLTGLYNRWKMDAELDRCLALARRYGRPVGVALLDLDGFRQVNERHGHAAADEVLVEVGRIVRHCTRSCDLVGRWGGEELLVVSPESDTETTGAFAERVLATVATHRFGLDSAITMSGGVTEYQVDDTRASLLERVERALGEAKARGRNQVVAATLREVV